jgi:hypothetical protein
MDEAARQTALMTALTTEHFVLQTAASSTISEASARSSLYVLSLSSSLVALGFTSQLREVFIPFVSAVIPAVFLLGLFTVMRLVDTSLEHMQYLTGIARIRSYYRSLGPEAAVHFAASTGRWPEAVQSTPALRLGPSLAYLGTTASMIAVTNNVLAGVGVAMLAKNLLDKSQAWLAIPTGIASAVLLTVAFLVYQRWRFSQFDGSEAQRGEPGQENGK